MAVLAAAGATLAAASAALIAVPARAAEDPVAAVRACLAERDDARRLACFDAAASRLPAGSSRATGAPPAVSASAAGAAAATPGTAGTAGAPSAASAAPAADALTPEQRFGYSGQIAKESVAKQKAESLEQLTQKVVRADRQPTGDFVVTLENGQVWAQLATGTPQQLKAGDTVTIKAGAFGSYTLLTPSGRGARVRRVR